MEIKIYFFLFEISLWILKLLSFFLFIIKLVYYYYFEVYKGVSKIKKSSNKKKKLVLV
jgi:hypothetical protein